MKLLLSLLITIVCANAHAWLPTCETDSNFDTRAKAARAINKAMNAMDAEVIFTAEADAPADLQNFAPLSAWVLDEVNKDSLLREQILPTINEINLPRSGSGQYEILVDKDNITCRRKKFSAGDVRFVSSTRVGNQLSFRFYIVARYTEKWSELVVGEEFEANFEIMPKPYPAYYLRITTYPQFIKEQQLEDNDFGGK